MMNPEKIIEIKYSTQEIFCNYVEQTYDRLDILINNAAQTVRRPPGFYTHLNVDPHFGE